jgi:hypothetical protein
MERPLPFKALFTAAAHEDVASTTTGATGLSTAEAGGELAGSICINCA